MEAWDYLAKAAAIDEAGRIAGYGLTMTGDVHAFLLTPMQDE